MATKRTPTGQSLPDRLAAARDAVVAARAARDDVAMLPARSPAETRARVRLMLEAAGEDPARALRAHVRSAQAGHRADGPMLGVFGADITGALVALFGVEEIMGRLDPVFARLEPGPDSAERARLLAEADRVLFEAELAEERAVMALEAQGMPVSRRADADPRAVLALQGAA